MRRNIFSFTFYFNGDGSITVEYNENIGKQIIGHLDGWVMVSTVTEEVETVEPFINDITDFQQKNSNKKITDKEVQDFFNICLDKALLYCNRWNIDDLSEVEEGVFIRGVCLWAASDLWNKYNIRVNNEDMEDTYIQSYGGLLYKQSMLVLKPFIRQRITGLQAIKNKEKKNDNIWII